MTERVPGRNKALVIRAFNHIKKNPEEWQQGIWGYKYLDSAYASCGTTGCLAGHMTLLDPAVTPRVARKPKSLPDGSGNYTDVLYIDKDGDYTYVYVYELNLVRFVNGKIPQKLVPHSFTVKDYDPETGQWSYKDFIPASVYAAWRLGEFLSYYVHPMFQAGITLDDMAAGIKALKKNEDVAKAVREHFYERLEQEYFDDLQEG